MNLHVLFFGTLAGFAFLKWWAVPQVEVAWAANSTPDKLAKVGLVAFLKAVRTVLQIATVTYGLLLAAAWLLDALGHPANASALRDEIEYLERLKEPLAYINESIASKITFAVALFGLAYLIYRRHRADLIAQVSARVASEIERLAESPLRRLWPHLPALLTSRGLMRDSGLPAKGLSYVGTAITCLSLVGLSGTLLQPPLAARVAHAWDLAVSADQADARRSWDKVRAERDEDTQPSRLPTSLEAHKLAHVFLNAYFSSPALHSAENTVTREPADRLLKQRDPISAAEVNTLHPETQLEERLGRRLEQEPALSLRGRFAAKLEAYKRSYAEPAEPSAVFKELIGKLLDPALDALQPDSVPTAVKPFTKGVKTAVERSIEMQFDRFLTGLSGDLSLEAALSQVAHAIPEKAGLTPAVTAAVASFFRDIEQRSNTAAMHAPRDHAGLVRRDVLATATQEIGRLTSQIDDGRRRTFLWLRGVEVPPSIRRATNQWRASRAHL